MKAYHIAQWDTLYETAETRKIRNLTFYAKSNKLVGLGINRTRQTERGLELLGIWALLEALASLAPQAHRGWLVRNGKRLDAKDIAFLISVPQEPVERAIKHFLAEEIGWLEEVEFTGGPTNSGRDRGTAGTPPGESPTKPPTNGTHRENLPPISARGKRDREERLTSVKKERRTEFATGEGEAAAQSRQFASCEARRKELQAIPDDERTPEEEAELKKVRATLKAIQKKQRAGDFTVVTEEPHHG